MMCAHEAKGRKLASTVAALASEREAARLAGDMALVRELEHSRQMTLVAMHWNSEDHETTCEEGAR